MAAVWFTIDFGEGIGVVRDGRVQRLPKKGRNVEPIGLGCGCQRYRLAYGSIRDRGVAHDARRRIAVLSAGHADSAAGRLAVAPDGAVWFAESTAYSITRLKDGVFQRHDVQSVRGGPYGVAVAADGTVWATLQSANQAYSHSARPAR